VYLYDAEGRICAVETPGINGLGPIMTGYVYDADGNRRWPTQASLGWGRQNDLSRKPRHGVESRNPAPHPGIDERNSTLAIGFRASLVLDAVRQSERARYYSSNDARFLTPDPSGLMYAQLTNPQSLNLYNYVGNDPLSRVDLMGLCWKGFKWACDAGNGIKHFVVSAKNKIRYDEWTTNTTQAEIRSLDRYEAKHRQEEYQKETAGNKSGLKGINQVPWEVSWILPLDPVPGLVGVGPAGSVAVDPQTQTVCISIGAGASVGDNIAGGPLMGRTLQGKRTTPSQTDNILKGWSVNFGANSTTGALPVGPGAQMSINGSGIVYGPTVGVAGVSVSSTYAYCPHY
jgi:RHS repeat-associated protein